MIRVRSRIGTLILRLVVNSLALFVAALVIPDITYQGWQAIVLAAAIFGVVNAFIRPLALVLTCLINVFTLGLFTLVINAAMLILTSWAAEQLNIAFHVGSFWGAFWGALIIALVSWSLSRFVH